MMSMLKTVNCLLGVKGLVTDIEFGSMHQYMKGYTSQLRHDVASCNRISMAYIDIYLHREPGTAPPHSMMLPEAKRHVLCSCYI